MDYPSSVRDTGKCDDDEDAFWAVAFLPRPAESVSLTDEDDDLPESISTSSRVTRYRLPSHTPTVLKLESLPDSNGVWNLLGGDAWYASALLASFFFLASTTNKESDTSSSTQSNPSSPYPFSFRSSTPNAAHTILELGSGAVGLSGLACAVVLQQQTKEATGDFSPRRNKWNVILTDNEESVLQQLEKNVDRNMHHFTTSSEENHDDSHYNVVAVTTDYLDWNKYHSLDESSSTTRSTVRHRLAQDELTLVIGSELVYNQETADACVTVLQGLLQDHPSVEIWIIQVTDRYGWMETVIPTLLSTTSTKDGPSSQQPVVVGTFPVSLELHEMASHMVPMGGTLDRQDYGIFRIANKRDPEDLRSVS